MAAAEHLPGADALSVAAEDGKICALAMDCQRDLQECAGVYPDLFPSGPFDPRLLSGVALANAFGSPWATPDQLRIATRTSLWVFAADWAVDYVATSREDVDDVTRACLAVADGAPPVPGVPLTHFLADIRDELTAGSVFANSRPIWREQLRRYLDAMAREWNWQQAWSVSGTALPTFEEYLENADNFGSSWVNISHWIFTGDSAALEHLGELWTVSNDVQRILRLLNDLISYKRELEWGDLNALMLGVDRADIAARIKTLVGHCQEQLIPLAARCPQQTVYLKRQIGYSMGFYGSTDYWGTL